jgi:hypothetical protein
MGITATTSRCSTILGPWTGEEVTEKKTHKWLWLENDRWILLVEPWIFFTVSIPK